jgi:lipopolysaccharide export LptBFGC system permease protein LptF
MLGDFMGKEASWLIIAEYFLLKQPGDIKFVLPISLLLSTIYTMAKFGMNNEISAMRASGISLLRCGVSLYIIGLIVTGVNFWFNASVVPNCIRKASILQATADNPNYIQQMTRMLVYRTPNGDRTWLINNFISNNEQAGVQIKKYNKNVLDLELYAKKAKYSFRNGWEFFDVKLIRYIKMSLTDDYSTGTLGDKQTVVAPVSQSFVVFDKKNKEYSDLGHFFETPTDFFNVIRPPEEWTSADIMSVLERAEELSGQTKNYYKTILYTRWAFPWVCILSVFLAIPLAASNERRGIIVSVASAVGVVILYQIISQIFMVLGQKNYLPAIVAGVAPTAILAIYVWYNVNKYK